MSNTAKNVEGNTKKRIVTCGLAVRWKVVGGGGTTHVSICHVYLLRMKHGYVLYASTDKILSL